MFPFDRPPPRCLSSLQTAPVELPGFVFDGHSFTNRNALYALRCLCGEAVLGVRGKNSIRRNLDLYSGPVEAVCHTCGRITEIIDVFRHGYNGEQHWLRGERREPEKEVYPSMAECASCGRRAFTLVARFEYGPGAERYGEFSEWAAGREQDLFSWFTLVGHCQQCGQLSTLTEYECS